MKLALQSMQTSRSHPITLRPAFPHPLLDSYNLFSLSVSHLVPLFCLTQIQLVNKVFASFSTALGLTWPKSKQMDSKARPIIGNTVKGYYR